MEANNEGETHAVTAAPVQIMLFLKKRKIFERGRFCQLELTGEAAPQSPKASSFSDLLQPHQRRNTNRPQRTTQSLVPLITVTPSIYSKSNFMSDTVTEGRGKSERLFKKKMRNKCKAD